MSRKAFAFFVVVVFASFAVACGGGNPPPFDEGSGDVAEDNIVPPDVHPDVDEDVNVPDADEDIRPDTNEVVEDKIEPPDTTDVKDDVPMEVVDDAEVVEEVQIIDFCPCDENVNEPVCGTDDNTYKSPQCAACALCSPDPVQCPDCEGSIDCQGEPDKFIKRMTACDICPCTLQDECDLQAQPIEQCKEVCAVDGETEYADLCAFKTAMGCDDNYDDQIGYFGKCLQVCPACEEFDANNPAAPEVCGSDNETYKNVCWLGNCPSVAGVTKSCNQACPCPL